VGQGFGGFLDLREKVFFLAKCPVAVLPLADRVFIMHREHEELCVKKFTCFKAARKVMRPFPVPKT
jgi:hypothetical protein